MTKEIRLPNLGAKITRELIPDGAILVGYRGSHAHNTYIPPTDPDSVDDIDIMTVFVPGLEYYFGLKDVGNKNKGTIERMIEVPEQNIIWDSVAYEIRKFIFLLLKGNPNVLMMLWLPDNQYIYKHHLGQMIIDSRDIFVNKQAYHHFVGYANGQLHRMGHHERKGRMGAKRKALIEKHGYDTKNASHLIRLLRMGTEFLIEGELHPFRQDAHELKAIKRGEWSLEKIKEESDKWFNLAHEAYVKSNLPAKPRREDAEKLVVEIIKEFHNIHVFGPEHDVEEFYKD